jgi:hypothetical protein
MPMAVTAVGPPAGVGCQALESVLHRKMHGAFGEGPTEKGCMCSTSPAAYSTYDIRRAN